ncbi:MAG: toll/interleukin-1 receptor domain-containing protein, partial [Actinoplanes sp.]
LLLIAMVEELLRHDVALRETTDGGVDLVFPTQLTADSPDAPGAETADLVFRFDGAVRPIYATLVVRLTHVTAYHRDEMWRNAATYRAVVGGVCGLRVRESEEGRGELTVFFENASEETEFLFERYVQAHLTARALPGSVRRERVFTCPGCAYRLPGDLVRRRQARGHRDMPCPDCEEVRISLLDREDRLGSAAQVRDMNASADAGRNRAAATATIRGKEATKDFDVFISYNSKDREAARDIADRLRAAGLLPWFDTSDLPPGGRWQNELQAQIGRVRCGAVLVGPHGLGRWQRMEQEELIAEHTRRDGFRIVPVLLPGAPADLALPGFLGQWNAVDFRVEEPDPFERLRWAVTGERPAETYLG